MIVDTSALLSILFGEPERNDMLTCLSFAERRRMAAPNWLEACLVVDNRGNAKATQRLDSVVKELRIEVVPFDEGMANLARAAHQRFGRGKHPAALNFGDCVAYALAKHADEPLLFKGNDFVKTDITAALS